MHNSVTMNQSPEFQDEALIRYISIWLDTQIITIFSSCLRCPAWYQAQALLFSILMATGLYKSGVP